MYVLADGFRALSELRLRHHKWLALQTLHRHKSSSRSSVIGLKGNGWGMGYHLPNAAAFPARSGSDNTSSPLLVPKRSHSIFGKVKRHEDLMSVSSSLLRT